MTAATPDPEETATGGTVLVVDDEPHVREVIQIMLRRGGHRTIEAADGHQALETVRERQDEIDVVLLDVMMPRMTGHEALPAIRELAPGMPVVFVSGYDREEVAEHLAGEVHTSFLPKPFDREGLLAVVAAAIGSARNGAPPA